MGRRLWRRWGLGGELWDLMEADVRLAGEGDGGSGDGEETFGDIEGGEEDCFEHFKGFMRVSHALKAV